MYEHFGTDELTYATGSQESVTPTHHPSNTADADSLPWHDMVVTPTSNSEGPPSGSNAVDVNMASESGGSNGTAGHNILTARESDTK